MNLYWLYDIPNWLFHLIVVGFFVGFSLLGALIFNRYFETKLNLSVETNTIVAIFLSLSGVFYGITLGLIAVGTFENFTTAEDIVTKESSSLAALYRDVTMLEGQDRKILTTTLKKFLNYRNFSHFDSNFNPDYK